MQDKSVQDIWSLRRYIGHKRPLHLFGVAYRDFRLTGTDVRDYKSLEVSPTAYSVFQYVLSVTVKNG